jgi:hypothetical protein
VTCTRARRKAGWLPPPLFQRRKENGGEEGAEGTGLEQEEVILGAGWGQNMENEPFFNFSTVGRTARLNGEPANRCGGGVNQEPQSRGTRLSAM